MLDTKTSLKHPSGNQCLIVTVLFACFFCLTGCYENSDGTTTDTTETEFPKVTNDGFLIGTVVENGEIISDYTLELNDQDYGVEKQFYLELERANKLFQPISVYKGGELIAFAVTPILYNEVNLVEVEVFSRSESHQITQSLLSVELSQRLSLTIDGSDMANENVDQINIHLLDNSIGYSGNENNVKRFAINHLDAFILDAGDQSLNSILTYTGYELTAHLGLFRFDRITSDWSLVREIDASQGTLPLETDGIYSIAEYIPAVIIAGELTHEGQQLGFAKIEIANGSLTSPYKHYSTGTGKYLAFVEQDADVEIAIQECDAQSIEQVTTMKEDRENVTIDFQDYEGSVYKVAAKVINCGTSQTSTTSASLINQDGESLIIPSNHEVTLAACSDHDYNLAVDLVDESQFSLPWSEDIDDPYIFLPNCAGVTDGYGYLMINGESKYYETFARDNTIADQIVLTSSGGEFQIRLRNNVIGHYETNEVNLVVNDVGFGQLGYAVDCGTSQLGCGLDYCQVTHLDSEWLRVSFAGEVWMQTLQALNAGNYEVEGNILIKL